MKLIPVKNLTEDSNSVDVYNCFNNRRFMKKLTLLTLVFISFSSRVFAVDTTGCSQMKTKVMQTSTNKGAALKVMSVKAPNENCWNKDLSYLQIQYQWRQSSQRSEYQQIGFWIQVNGDDSYETVQYNTIVCQFENKGMSYGHQTSGDASFTCTATIYKNMTDINLWQVEVSPEVDHQWDTSGFKNNYNFSL